MPIDATPFVPAPTELPPSAGSAPAWAAPFLAEVEQHLGLLRSSMIGLVYGHGLSQAEVARLLDLPLATVRTEIARSLQLVDGVVCRTV
jgi:DNA-directed RNA polymerase specialized sigma24 family protein